MRTHKYIRRTGSKGNYKYWYKLPDGRVVSSEDADSPMSHERAKIDHIKRLIAGRIHTHHNMTPEQMADHVGVPIAKVRNAMANMDRDARHFRARPAEERAGAHFGREHGHIYSHEEMKEAAHEKTDTPEYGATIARTVEEPAAPAPAPRRRSPRRTLAPAAAPAAAPAESDVPDSGAEKLREAGFRPHEGGGYHRHVTHGSHRIVRISDARGYQLNVHHAHMGDEVSGGLTLDGAIELSKQIEQRHQTEMGRRAEAEATAAGADVDEARSAAEAAAAPAAAPAAPAAAPAAPAQANQEKIRKLREKLAREHGIALGEPPAAAPAEATRPTQSPAEAKAAAVRAAQRAAASPRSEAAAAMHQAAPDLAEADRPIQRMEEAAERGENPYFNRAKEIYHNIVGDLKPERKQTIDHVMQALNNLKMRGEAWDKPNIIREYKAVSGKRIRELSGIAKEFERGTFMTLDEIIENKPVDAEVERMKSGYAARQFARFQPFVKSSWKESHPGAPPPYPTFGDVMSWSELGGPKPAWAGTTRLAVPEEVFNAVHKGEDGKPKYPPSWMPIHLMPVWNYVVKGEGDSAYQSGPANITQGRLNLGNQSPGREGMIISALRKYVQMRGGPNQLVDIPAHKLSEVGLTHSDIFKSSKNFDDNDLSDAALKRLLRHKIVDPVALQPFLDAELKGSMKKSFALVIDQSVKPVVFTKSFSVDLKKAEIIRKIKELRAKR